jgi:hypothetical protein
MASCDPEDMTPPGVFVTHSPELRDTYVAALLTGKPYESLVPVLHRPVCRLDLPGLFGDGL